MDIQVLDILKRLEDFRKKVANGEIKEGSTDWAIRMCQAEVARGVFESRADWTNKINR